MILDVDREVPLTAPERDALRNRPARQRAVALEPKVVVEAPRVVSLDHESRRGTGLSRLSERLRCFPTTLPPVFVEAHLWIVARFATLFFTNWLHDDPFPCSGGNTGISLWEGGENVRRRPGRPSRGTSHGGGGGVRRARVPRSPRMQREWPVRGAPRPHRDPRAPPRGSATIASTTPSSRQCAASGRNAAAALRPARIPPQDCRAAFRRDDGVDGVLLHHRDRRPRSIAPPDPPSPMTQATVGPGAPSRPASARWHRPARAAPPRLPVRPRCVDHRHERKAVPPRERHGAHRLAVSLRYATRSSVRALLEIAPLLMADEDDRLVVEPSEARPSAGSSARPRSP